MKIRSLRHLLAIRSAWIAVIPFLLSVMMGWFWLRPRMIADIEEHQLQLATSISSRIEAHLASSREAIERTAMVFSKRLVGPYALQEYLDTVLASSGNLDSITFTNPNDCIIATALPKEKAALGREMTGIDLSLTGAVRQVRQSGKPAWSDTYLSPVGGGMEVAYASPAAGGVMLGEFSLAQLSDFLGIVATRGKQSIFIIDRRGQVIADQEGRFTAQQYNLSNFEIVREGLASGKPVSGSFSFDGERVVGSLVRASVLDWYILVTSPTGLMYRSNLTTPGITGMALCMALLLAAGLSLLMSHYLVTRFDTLISHARMIESGGDAGDWPKDHIMEFNLLGESLQSMANELRERENRLKEQLHFLQQLLDSIPIPVFYKDTRGVYQGCNAAFEVFTDMTRDKIIGKTVHDVVPQYQAERHHKVDLVLLGNPGIQIYEECGAYIDDECRDIIFNKATYVDAENRVSGIVGALIDITTLRRAEEELRESEKTFRVLAETSPAAIFLHQGERFIYTNPATTRISGYDAGELLEMNFWEWGDQDEWEGIRKHGVALLRGEPEPPQYEHGLITKSGEGKWVLVSAGVTEYRGKPTVISTLLDITEAKKGEERIKAALEEKIILLKEVHHRVKNNMQIISSLLEIQSEFVSDEIARACLRESQERVRSLALIHERLYKSRDISSVDLGEYISDLSRYLFNSYVVEHERVSLNVDTGNISLDISRAVQCGLIINELISNSLKHAFPEGRRGDISVRISHEGGWITLEVADTGIGMPPALDAGNAETLGLQLVNLLTRQLRGRVSFGGGQEGAITTVSFPEEGEEI